MSSFQEYAPLSDGQWPPSIADMLGSFAGKLNVYRTMAHNPSLLRAWAALRQHLVIDTTLGREHSEIVILRVGHLNASEYEWRHHVARARALGISDARIASMSGPIELMAPKDALLASGVDELVGSSKLNMETLSALTQEHGTSAVLDLMATIGMYSTLAYIANSCRVPVDLDVMREGAT